MAQSNVHRASALKQQNKKHKILGHKTKGQLKTQCKGKVSIQNLSRAYKHELSKKQRRHQSKQIRANKREESLMKKRQLGTSRTPPFLVAVIPVNLNINPRKTIQLLVNSDELSSSKTSEQGILHLSCGRLKQRFSFLVPPLRDLYSILDTVRVCDTILFVWKIGEEVDFFTEQVMSCLKSQGMPSVVNVVIDDEDTSNKDLTTQDDLESALKTSLIIQDRLHSSKCSKKARLLKDLQIDISSRFPSHCRPISLEKPQDANLVLRQIGSQKRQNIFYRDQRSHMIAEKVVFEEEDSTSGTLKLYGYVRGQPLSVNRLIHIPGWGEFQISQIDSLEDSFPLELNRKKGKDQEICSEEPKLLDVPDPKFQESLESSLDIDPMDDEQTWPTAEDLEDAAVEAKTSKKTRKLPKGTSEYQSAWFVDSDDEDGDSDEDLDNRDTEDVPPCKIQEDDYEDERKEINNEDEDSDDGVSLTLTDVGDEYDSKMDYQEEMTLLQKIRAAKEDSLFPDEMDTPMDLPARLRFQKYRGLQSFRTSPWDPNENLPPDYRRIVSFKSFFQTKRRIFKADQDGVLPGWYIIIHLKDVPRHLYLDHMRSQSPLTAFSLLPYEQKMSVVNFVLRSHIEGHTVPIQSKERLIFHVGVRRFANTPVFSEHTNGNKHKFVRFFQPGQIVVASMFAPVTFSPCPISVFKENANGSQDLVASGSFLSADPNRIICKRVVLSGHPFKINRKLAVVRYMFFNTEDILWFKSVELRTKWGRRGHIKEALGTHGHMKCQFDGHLKSQDTVMLNLYKRVFPKWHYDPTVSRPSFVNESTESRRKDSTSSSQMVTSTASDLSDVPLKPQQAKKRVKFK